MIGPALFGVHRQWARGAPVKFVQLLSADLNSLHFRIVVRAVAAWLSATRLAMTPELYDRL
jgi:hypothetical protein